MGVLPVIEDKHMAASLTEKRQQIAREIKDLEIQINDKREAIIHIDSTVAIFDPDAIVDTDTPNRRLRRNLGYFARGEITKRCLTALREANGEPITVLDIAAKAMADKKLDPDNRTIRKQFYKRFMAAMHSLSQPGGVAERVGRYRDVKWKLAD
jgi:hypothetical protein